MNEIVINILLALLSTILIVTLIVALIISSTDKEVYGEFSTFTDRELKKLLLKTQLNDFDDDLLIGEYCFYISKTGGIFSKYYLSYNRKCKRIPRKQNHFIERRIKFLKKDEVGFKELLLK